MSENYSDYSPALQTPTVATQLALAPTTAPIRPAGHRVCRNLDSLAKCHDDLGGASTKCVLLLLPAKERCAMRLCSAQQQELGVCGPCWQACPMLRSAGPFNRPSFLSAAGQRHLSHELRAGEVLVAQLNQQRLPFVQRLKREQQPAHVVCAPAGSAWYAQGVSM